MIWFQVISTVIFYCWLFIITYLLWRRAQKNDAAMQGMLTTLADITLKGVEPVCKAAEAAEHSANAARVSAELIQRTYDTNSTLRGDKRGTP